METIGGIGAASIAIGFERGGKERAREQRTARLGGRVRPDPAAKVARTEQAFSEIAATGRVWRDRRRNRKRARACVRILEIPRVRGGDQLRDFGFPRRPDRH